MCLCIHVSRLILKSLREVPVHVFVRVPSAHLALVTAPVTCVWFCSIPAPHRSSAGEQSNNRVLLDLCCRGSQDPWQYECTLLYSRLEMASCWPLRCYFFLSLSSKLGFLRGLSETSGGFFQTFMSSSRYVTGNTDSCLVQLFCETFTTITDLSNASLQM